MDFFVYIVRCADGSYYTGSHRGSDVMSRVHDHNNGLYPNSYTCSRRPVELVWSDWFSTPQDMIDAERRIKGWSRKKKEALIAGNFDQLPGLSKRRRPHPSRRAHPEEPPKGGVSKGKRSSG